MIVRALVLVVITMGLFGGLSFASVWDQPVEDRAGEARAAHSHGERSWVIDGEAGRIADGDLPKRAFGAKAKSR